MIKENLFFMVTILLSIYILFLFQEEIQEEINKKEENFKGSGGGGMSPKSGGMSPKSMSPKSGGGMSPKSMSPKSGGGMSPKSMSPKSGGGMSPKSMSPKSGGGMSPKSGGGMSPKSMSPKSGGGMSPKKTYLTEEKKYNRYPHERRYRIRDKILRDRVWGGWSDWRYWDYYPHYYYYHPGFITVFENGYVPYEEDEDYVYVVDENGLIKKYKKSCLKEQEYIENDGKVIKDECLWENM
jgi:hypothetical protein